MPGARQSSRHNSHATRRSLSRMALRMSSTPLSTTHKITNQTLVPISRTCVQKNGEKNVKIIFRSSRRNMSTISPGLATTQWQVASDSGSTSKIPPEIDHSRFLPQVQARMHKHNSVSVWRFPQHFSQSRLGGRQIGMLFDAGWVVCLLDLFSRVLSSTDTRSKKFGTGVVGLVIYIIRPISYAFGLIICEQQHG